ncbi:TPA: DUF1270 family protein, partial [Staphylococcus aureus]|nr:DUF1270 family protein [Staphylococcus aureus]HCV0059927.1 DUF1270 family protein [Staphylococcus aureus]HCV0254808.1 DUF1270 family protein [Staphylococcus aureus]HCV2268848.1 DUF1270 family protein [Staphylococcus aureus]HCV2356931.1 DUF1270 family protein [Staphylococcus aureus]
MNTNYRRSYQMSKTYKSYLLAVLCFTV